MAATDPIPRATPNTSAASGCIRPAGIGRLRVRDISQSMSRSYHMLIAPAAPAPSAMQAMATKAVSGAIDPGASSNPTMAVKTTSDMTFGLRMMA